LPLLGPRGRLLWADRRKLRTGAVVHQARRI